MSREVATYFTVGTTRLESFKARTNLKKLSICYPGGFFDPSQDYYSDNTSCYKFSFTIPPKFLNGLNDFEELFDLVYSYGHWSIKNKSSYIVGLSAKTFLKSLDKLLEANAVYSIITHDYIIIASVKKLDGVLRDFKVTVYLSNSSTPYADLIELLNERVKLCFPERECSHEGETNFKENRYSNRNALKFRFLAYVMWEDINFPVFALFKNDVLKKKFRLPFYLADCPGGFKDSDFRPEVRFTLWETRVYELPEASIIGMRITPKSELSFSGAEEY